MTIHENDVDNLLCANLPEFTFAVKEHRAKWPDEPMLYPLLAWLFDFVVKESSLGLGTNKELAQRAFASVERALNEGNPSVSDCFAIQMIEPIAFDVGNKAYPNFEPVMGRASKQTFKTMREWALRHGPLEEAIGRANATLGVAVLSTAGHSSDKAKVIANVAQWQQLRRVDRQSAYQGLLQRWREICGSAQATLTITGPRDTGFVILR